MELVAAPPGGSVSKKSTCSAGDSGLIPEMGRSPEGGHGNPLQYSCLENRRGPRSLGGCSPWHRKESDTTRWLSTHPQCNFYGICNCSLDKSNVLQEQGTGKVKLAESCPSLCDPVDYTVDGILQDRTLEWVAFPFSRGSSQPEDRTQVSHTAGGFFASWATREAQEQGRPH